MAGVGFDLLSLLPGMQPAQEETAAPQVAAPAAPAQQQQPGPWAQYLSDPANRAFMISAGLQMATGGWGNWSQQMAQALGKGAEAASGTETLQYEADEKNRENQRKSAEAAAGRKTQLDVAKIGAASRKEVAEARIAGMIERTRLNVQAKPGQEQKIWNDTYQNTIKAKDKDSFLTGKTDEEIEAIATSRADRALQSFRQTGTGGSGAESAAGAPAAKPQSAAPDAASPSATKKTYTDKQLRDDLAKLQTREGYWDAIRDPVKLNDLYQAHPHLQGMIRADRNKQIAQDALDKIRSLFGAGGQPPPAGSVGGAP